MCEQGTALATRGGRQAIRGADAAAMAIRPAQHPQAVAKSGQSSAGRAHGAARAPRREARARDRHLERFASSPAARLRDRQRLSSSPFLTTTERLSEPRANSRRIHRGGRWRGGCLIFAQVRATCSPTRRMRPRLYGVSTDSRSQASAGSRSCRAAATASPPYGRSSRSAAGASRPSRSTAARLPRLRIAVVRLRRLSRKTFPSCSSDKGDVLPRAYDLWLGRLLRDDHEASTLQPEASKVRPARDRSCATLSSSSRSNPEAAPAAARRGRSPRGRRRSTRRDAGGALSSPSFVEPGRPRRSSSAAGDHRAGDRRPESTSSSPARSPRCDCPARAGCTVSCSALVRALPRPRARHPEATIARELPPSAAERRSAPQRPGLHVDIAQVADSAPPRRRPPQPGDARGAVRDSPVRPADRGSSRAS